jgi:predicted nucleic acid-binding Zn ribbon protein
MGRTVRPRSGPYKSPNPRPVVSRNPTMKQNDILRLLFFLIPAVVVVVLVLTLR